MKFADMTLLSQRIFMLSAVLVALAVFWVGQRHIPPSTDESIIALQASNLAPGALTPGTAASMQPESLLGYFPVLFMAQPYLFPVEAYLSAPVAAFLPPGAFAARLTAFIMGLATLWLSFRIISMAGPWSRVWPAGLLLIFPSSYVAIHAYGYALPSYPSHLFFTATMAWLLLRYKPQNAWVVVICAGVTGALALAGQLMALPLVLMGGAIFFLAAKGLDRILHTGVYGLIASLGILPYMLARHLYPGAYDAVSGSWPWQKALTRLWDPLMNHVLPVAMGIQSTVFPDNRTFVELAPWLTTIWPFLWIAIVGAALLYWLGDMLRNRLSMCSPPTRFIYFAGIAVAALAMFALSRRSHSHTYRYLVVTAWSFPFIVAYVLAKFETKWLRGMLTAGVLALALFNAITLADVMRSWKQPGFAADEASLYDTRLALAYLENNNLYHVYASYHLAYRLTYLSGGKITATQYYNERFPGWPYPYKSLVDEARDVAYVMTPRFAINADKFEAHMRETGISYTVARLGEVSIYHDFHLIDERQSGSWLDPQSLNVVTSSKPGEGAAMLDGDPLTRWQSDGPQDTNMTITVTWKEPREIKGIYMFYDFYRHDRAHALALEVMTSNGWEVRGLAGPAKLEPVLFDHERPLYGHEFELLGFIGGQPVSGVRLRIAEPNPGRNWTIGEIRLRGTNDGVN